MIRPARDADHDRLSAIQSAALDHPWPGLLDAAVDGPPLLLVLDENGPLAYALVVPDHPVAYLAEFAVAPPAQGQGYGTRLMNGVLDRLRGEGFETLRLTARADDERVRSFYERFDFTVTDHLPDHYDDGDGVLMVLNL